MQSSFCSLATASVLKSSPARRRLPRGRDAFNHRSSFPKRSSAPRRFDGTAAAARRRRSPRRATADAILLGAVGDPAFDTAPRPSVRKRRCWGSAGSLGSTPTCGRRACGRASKRPGPLKPEVLAGTDMLVVRELTGGLYYGEPRGIEADGSAAHNTMRYSRQRDRAHRALRVRRGAPAPKARHLGRQGQRARDVAAVAAGRHRSRAATIRTSRSSTCSSTPAR